MSSRLSRRRALRWGVGALLAGVAGCSSDDAPTTEPTDDPAADPSTERPATSARPGTTDDAPTTDDPDPTTTTPEPDTGGAWLGYQRDAGNTGFNPDAVGPTDDVTFDWSGGGSSIESSPTVVDGTVYVGSDGGWVYAVDAATGATEWSYGTGQKVDAAPAVADGTVLVPARNGTLFALGAADGTERWTAQGIGGGRLTIQQGSVTVADGTAYLGSMEGGFYGFDTETGEQTLGVESLPGGEEEIVSTPAVVGGVAYVGTVQGNVYALDTETGTATWERNLVDGDAVYGSPAVGDGVVYVPTLGEGKLYAMDAVSGETTWTYDLGGAVHASPTLAHDAVFLGSNGGYIHAIERSDGTRRWRADAGGEVYASAAADAERVYAGSYGQTVRALDPESGEATWTYSDDVAFVDAAPTVVDGRLFVVSRTSPMLALSAP